MASTDTGKPRLRRTLSYNKVEELGEKERKQRMKQPDKPLHRHADSYFSTSSGFTNYRGLLNLCILLLVLSSARVALENVIKYGILVDPILVITIFLQNPYSWPSASLVVLSNIFILIGYTIEKAISKSIISEGLCFYLHVINLFTVITFPAAFILSIHPTPFFSCATLVIYTVIFLKLISYLQVNGWCRMRLRNEGPGRRRNRFKSVGDIKITDFVANGKTDTYSVKYPDNLKLTDMYYFMLAPTLCYELNFPHSARIRKRFLIKRILELLFLTGLIGALIQQWIVPTINNSMKPLSNMELSKIVERLLKLAIPNHFIWLLFFYAFFHSFLNVTAEILQFGDREFYKDWWNAENIMQFWTDWNIPVHRWASRHLYKPLIMKGYSKVTAAVVVFFVSAFFHEYLVSIPLQMFKLWAFFAMLGQVPYSLFVQRFLHDKNGNMAVWISLIIGQPIAILMYGHDYYVQHHMGSNI